VLLKKTSPSGGGLHPIEAFPLVVDVEGVAPGAYHYRVDRHALDLVRSMSREEARRCVVDFTAGQEYLASAPLLLVLSARFDRFFWKYRNHPRAYGVLLMDAAHLSQTLYLLCAELGLGAFVTAAVNGANIEELLGLDPLRHGVLAICGCGNPLPGGSVFEQVYTPYRPRETAIPD
jgi:SagB-type dehydrogenase family enzyme